MGSRRSRTDAAILRYLFSFQTDAKKQVFFCSSLVFRNFDLIEGTHAFPNYVRLPVVFRENSKNFWFSSHLIVPLSTK